MKHYASSKFWRSFEALPQQIKEIALHNYKLLRKDPMYPALHFKSECNGRYRSVHIGLHYRALGVPVPDGVQWFWIGTHAEYDKLLG